MPRLAKVKLGPVAQDSLAPAAFVINGVDQTILSFVTPAGIPTFASTGLTVPWEGLLRAVMEYTLTQVPFQTIEFSLYDNGVDTGGGMSRGGGGANYSESIQFGAWVWTPTVGNVLTLRAKVDVGVVNLQTRSAFFAWYVIY